MNKVLCVTALMQPKDDIVKFWQSVVGPNFDIVVSVTETLQKLQTEYMATVYSAGLYNANKLEST